MSDNLVLHMPEPAPRPQPSRGSRLLPLLLLVVLLLGGTAAWIYMGKLEVAGRVQGQYLPITPLMTANVAEVLAAEGQMVRAGQVLARLDGGGLARMEADARALVRSTRSLMEDTADRVAAAQAAEEYTVRRVALARHEEETLRRELEQRTHDLARAQLHMRNLDARGTPMTAQSRRDAEKAEMQARSRKESAADAYESASRSRAAVEGELRRARQEMEKARAAGRAAAPQTASAPAGAYTGSADPTLLTAPQDGRLLGRMPAPGQMLHRGEAVLHLAPGGSTSLWATGRVSHDMSTRLRPGQLCLVIPHAMTDTALLGVVEDVAGLETDPASQDTVPLRVRIAHDSAASLSAQVAEQPARLIIWGNDVPGLRHAAPLLARFGLL